MRKLRGILPVLALLAIALLAGLYLGWRWYGWDTLCTAEAPDGSRRAVVRCHWVPTGADARYHYYLTFDPPIEFRPVAGESTLKECPSAVKDKRVQSAGVGCAPAADVGVDGWPAGVKCGPRPTRPA